MHKRLLLVKDSATFQSLTSHDIKNEMNPVVQRALVGEAMATPDCVCGVDRFMGNGKRLKRTYL